jgi:hypothetical protein
MNWTLHFVPLMAVFVATPVRAENRCGSFAASYLDAQQAHDLDRFLSLFASDFVSFQPLSPGDSFKGLETVRAHWQAIFMLGLKQSGKPDFRSSIDQCAEETFGDRSKRIRMTQTWQGGFDAAGEPCLKTPIYQELTVKRGKIVYVTIYFDPSALGQLMACIQPD